MRRIIAYFQVPRRLATYVVAISATALIAAYVSQYVFGLKPCVLCLYQRVPYFISIVLGVLIIMTSPRFPRLVAPLLWALPLVFLVGAGIAGFHVGVEYKWWPGLPSCGGAIVPENVSIEELRRALTQQNIVRCDEPAFTLFGVSMAGYNFLLSIGLALDMMYLLLWPRKQ